KSTEGDVLKLTSAGVVTAASLAHVSNIEFIQLSDKGNTITLADSMAASSGGADVILNGHDFAVAAYVMTGAGKDTVDLSQLQSAAGQVVVVASAGDKYIGSSGNDVFVFEKSSDLTSATQVDGGSDGIAELLLAGGTYTAAQFKGVHNLHDVAFGDKD